MKEHSIAVSVSVLFHVIIVAMFLRVPFDQYIKPKLMVLDFSLVKGRLTDDAARFNPAEGGKIGNRESGIVNRETQIVNRKSQIASGTTENEGTIMNREQNVQRSFVTEAPLAKQNNGNTTASDPAGKITIREETGPMVAKADDASGKHVSVGGDSHSLLPSAGGSKIIDYGKDSSGVRDFPFIADTINRRFKDKYPERARRMGWEGEVLVSFAVSEDGVVHDVEVVKSSGRSVFDNHVRDILAKTTFDRRLPYPLKIENRRIIYKLQ